MSRSRKSIAVFKDNSKGHNFGKKYSNRMVRKALKEGFDLPNGKTYKRLYDTWNIHDYVSRSFTKRELEELDKLYDGKLYKAFIK